MINPVTLANYIDGELIDDLYGAPVRMVQHVH